MKIRIRENTLRIRITQSELEKLGKGMSVKSSIHFPNGTLFSYGLQVGEMTNTTILFENNVIHISLGKLDIETILEDTSVGIQSIHSTKAGALDLLIEKDFTCLHPRDIEDADTFPNPNRNDDA